jgi:O-antigen/teichoic acid export membrane protein
MFFRRLAKDSAIYGGCDFFTKFISFFSFPLIAAVLSPKAFGALELIGTITGLLVIFARCGLHNSVQRFYWDKDTTAEIQPIIVTSGFVSLATLSICVLILGIIAIPWLMPLVKQAMWPLTWVALLSALLLMALSQCSEFALGIMRLHFAPWRFLALSLVSRVVSMGFGLVAVVFLGLGIDGLLGAQVLVLLFTVPVALWMVRRDFQPSKFDQVWAGKLVKFGFPFIFVDLAYILFSSMDRWMLAYFSSLEEVGVYSVALRFASVVAFVSSAFGQAWSPMAIKIITDHPDQYRKLFGQVLLVLLVVMMVVGGAISLFAGELIALIMPREYWGSALPLTILCFGIVLQSTQQVTAIGISIEKKTYLFARVAWFAVCVNFVLNLLLIPPLGATGAAWATLISYIVMTTAYLHYTQKLHPIKLQWRYLGSLLGLGCLVCAVAVLFVATEISWKIIALKFSAGILCCILSLRLIPWRIFLKNPL